MVTVWRFCGCVVDFSGCCSVKLIHASHLKCSNWRKLGIGYYICANSILDQGHQPQLLLQIRHQCVTSHLGWLPPFQQWFCSFHWAIQLLTASRFLTGFPLCQCAYFKSPLTTNLYMYSLSWSFPFMSQMKSYSFQLTHCNLSKLLSATDCRVSSPMLSTLFSLAKDEIVCLGMLKLQHRLGLQVLYSVQSPQTSHSTYFSILYEYFVVPAWSFLASSSFLWTSTVITCCKVSVRNWIAWWGLPTLQRNKQFKTS